MNQNVTVFKDPEKLADHVSDRIMKLISDTEGSRFDLAISGGTTPNLLFAALASKYANSALWQKTHFWWVDERMVSSRHPESNFGTANKFFFSKIEIPERNIHRIRGEEDPFLEAKNYSVQIVKNLGFRDGWPMFDMILLGMGEDGHTASIFPNQIGLMMSDHLCEVAHHPSTNQARITLTGKVLNNANQVWFLITGSGKAKCMAEIITGTEKSSLLPAACINPSYGELSWFLDDTASRFLS